MSQDSKQPENTVEIVDVNAIKNHLGNNWKEELLRNQNTIFHHILTFKDSAMSTELRCALDNLHIVNKVLTNSKN